MEFLAAYASKLVEVAPIFVPTLAVLFQWVAISNGYWRAIHRLPFIKSEAPQAPVGRLLKWKIILCVALYGLCLSVAAIVPVFIEDEKQGDIIVASLWLLPFTGFAFTGCALYVKGIKFAVKRSVDGKPVAAPQPSREVGKLAIILTIAGSLCLSLASLWPWLGQPYALGSVFYMFTMVSCGGVVPRRVQQMRKNVVAAFVFLGVAVWIGVKQLVTYLQGEENLQALRVFNFTKNNSLEFLVSIFLTPVLCDLAAMLYRFDCRQMLLNDAEMPLDADIKKIVLTPKPFAELVVSAFEKPYFTVALRALCITILAMPALSVLNVIDVDVYNFNATSLLFAYPAMLIAANAWAVWKGEWKEFILYKEDWTFNPEAKCGIKPDEKEKESAALNEMVA